MRNFGGRAISALLLVLMIAATVCSALIPVSASENKLSTDTEKAALDQYSKVMVGVDVSSYQGNVDWAKVKASLRIFFETLRSRLGHHRRSHASGHFWRLCGYRLRDHRSAAN